MKTKLFVSAAAMMALTVIASAQTKEQPSGQSGQSGATGTAWVDTDNDGICDNFENGARQGRRPYSAGENQAAANRGPGRGQGLARRNEQGNSNGPTQRMRTGHDRTMSLAQGTGSRHPRGRGMMAGEGEGRGRGVAHGRGLHNGQGPAFTDANNDGVCDNLTNTIEKK